MKIVALTGKSGTGKSHRAVGISHEKNLEAIIDDGLLIMSNKVLAGKSAKKESTKMASVKRALFYDENHVKEVRNAIIENKIESLLILGTSRKMVDRICEILKIGEISEYINIEEIQTKKEIETAREMRNIQGKHIIPVTSLEIKKDFSGYFLHPIKTLQYTYGKKEFVSDKTVIRPTYSYLGGYSISDNAIAQIVEFDALRIEGVERIFSITVNNTPDGAHIAFGLSVGFGVKIPELSRKISKKITADIDKMTSINVDKIDINVKDIITKGSL